MDRKLRMGMVGGGKEAFIGPIHRMAAQLDGLIELSCGAFSATPAKSQRSGRDLFLPEDRIYDDYEQMFRRERGLPDGVRMDFVSIVTPNSSHFPIARVALESGFAVVCEKPMTFDLEEARQLEALVGKTGLRFGLTHNYTGYPMVKEAKQLLASGKLGTLRKVLVEYPQGWLSGPLELTGQKQAEWRTDPERVGASCCIGDIGTHAANLSEYITGVKIEEVCAELTTFVPGRRLDDDGNVLIRFHGGARGVLTASQIAVAEENGLKIRVYGDKGGLEWRQEEPNTLILKWTDRPREVLRTGVGSLSKQAQFNTRLPAGHPEGYIEGFANFYRNFALTLIHEKMGEPPKPEHLDFPKVSDGVRGMAFIRAVTESSRSDRKWIRIPERL